MAFIAATNCPDEIYSLRAFFGERMEGADSDFSGGDAAGARMMDEIPLCTKNSSDALLPKCSALVALHPGELS